MSESSGKERKKLSLSGKGTLSLKTPSGKTPGDASSRAGSSSTTVEVRRKRTPEQDKKADAPAAKQLTNEEREARIRALKQAQTTPKKPAPAPSQGTIKIKKQEEPKKEDVAPQAKETSDKPSAEDLRQKELDKLNKIKTAEQADADAAEEKRQEDLARLQRLEQTNEQAKTFSGRKTTDRDDDDKKTKAVPPKRIGDGDRRRGGKITVSQALNNDFESGRTRSLAAQRRAREKERMQAKNGPIETVKQVRDVTIPEVITVQELANRMAERVGDVVKKLMEMGVMATATQNVDADTAELITQEFGHKVKRVSDADVEADLIGEEDNDTDLELRPPVVTVMGHVDHGKTSLLDALRETDVTAKEAGGITQHIGAYQIKMDQGQKITFIDTPGHAAFTEMRARGADVTDIVVLVVAADDSVMPQTIEAINHAKAAKKPIIVAINKCDLPDADPNRVRTELLQHEIVVESMSGDVQDLEVSAKNKLGLKELEEAILLQSEVMELKANPNRTASGAVVEARLEQGKGSVATVLIQRGTLQVGDIFITGSEWGKVRALLDDRGKNIDKAVPGQPVEILGLNGTPDSGDDFVVVKDEAKAREIAEFRERQKRALQSAKANKGSLEQMMQQIKDGEAKDLNIVIKGDVHGSVEAMASTLTKLTEENEEVKVNLLHTGVGAITESDVTLANASDALIVGFNVRANAQARDLAKQEGVEIRYYSIIYNVIDDVKALLGGMLSPELSEEFIGYAEIRQVFNISRVGKIAGCMVTDGQVKRGAKVRLLRDNVVIHEGMLKTLQRFKDEVKEVREGFECGMAFESYDDIKEGDMIEAFEIVEKTRTLEDIQKEREQAKKKEKKDD